MWFKKPPLGVKQDVNNRDRRVSLLLWKNSVRRIQQSRATPQETLEV